MAPRANWKGTLKIGEVTCPIALYTAASTSDRIAFHTINRATGHRVRRVFVDSETGDPVDSADQAKGYQLGDNDYVVLTSDELAAAVPESDKVLAISAFVPCTDVDDVYLDKPYYLAPTQKAGDEAFALIREGMRQKKVVAIAQTVLFRRMRTLLIRPHGPGLIGTTLNFDYEVRAADQAFKDVSALKLDPEMLELAQHIISKKMGKFDISNFEDRYEAALAELVKAKVEGKSIPPRKEQPSTKVVDLLAALRESAGATKPKAAGRKKAEPAAKPTKQRKAG